MKTLLHIDSSPREERSRSKQLGKYFRKGEPNFSMNHLEPHIRTVFQFIGINDFHFIYCGNDEYGGEKLERSITEAMNHIEDIVGNTKSMIV